MVSTSGVLVIETKKQGIMKNQLLNQYLGYLSEFPIDVLYKQKRLVEESIIRGGDEREHYKLKKIEDEIKRKSFQKN